MTEIKLTKNEMRTQQVKLNQLTKYLPTLQLKKAMLQTEVQQAELAIVELSKAFSESREALARSEELLSDPHAFALFDATKIKDVVCSQENIAGIDVPLFQEVVFSPRSYPLYATPLWLDTMVEKMKEVVRKREEVRVAEEKKKALEKELRNVSIRVNLFEKILIPRTQENIKRIKVFLSDQQLASVARAKVAKKKIEGRKQVAQ